MAVIFAFLPSSVGNVTYHGALALMDRVSKVHRGARHLVFKDGLRTLFPACQGTLPAKMARLLERLDDDKRKDAPLSARTKNLRRR